MSTPRAVSLLFAALAIGCADPTRNGVPADDLQPGPLTAPATRPDIVGTITRVMPGDSVFRAPSGGNPSGTVSCPPSCAPIGTPMRTVLIEERPGTASGDAKSVMKVPRETRLLRRSGTTLVAIGFDALRTGQRVEGWFEGPVMESYPSQGTAKAVVVID